MKKEKNGVFLLNARQLFPAENRERLSAAGFSAEQIDAAKGARSHGAS